jgi:NAD(P)-dependent dehydrogenase (short-subunit alcohol dehydrogenase family)
MAADLKSRNVVITGGTGALGSAVVKEFLDQSFLDGGATCHVTWVLEHELTHFPYRDRVTLHQVDCADEQAVAKLYQSLDKLWASIHIVGGFAMAAIEKTSADDFRAMFDMNALTCFLCCREAVKLIRKTRGGGRIVNVAARPALVPAGGMIAYTTSKAAVANRKAMPDADFDAWPKVEQVASAIAFLAGPSNALTSGEVVPVYGKA